MHTYWALALANLADHAEGRGPVVRCDFTSAVLRGEVLIDADRLAVYASLTEPEQFSRWSGAKVEAELRPGGRLVELRRFHEIDDWRTLWVEVHLEGIPDGLLTSN